MTVLAGRPGTDEAIPGERANGHVAELLDDLAAQLGFQINQGKNGPVLVEHDGKVAETWRQDYPYDKRLGRKRYEREKRGLQIELLSCSTTLRQPAAAW